MNVYDFDQTIYDGDSTFHFIGFCLKKKPSLIFPLSIGVGTFVLYLFHQRTKTQSKEKFFAMFQKIERIDDWVEAFWDGHIHRIKAWYLEQKQPDDLIISASPAFLLRPACRRLGIKHLEASRVDRRTGKYTGINCYGEEKVRRFRESYTGEIDAFYSDSVSDLPLARIAKAAFLVEGEKCFVWKTED